jgi:hypothetical protein
MKCMCQRGRVASQALVFGWSIKRVRPLPPVALVSLSRWAIE